MYNYPICCFLLKYNFYSYFTYHTYGIFYTFVRFLISNNLLVSLKKGTQAKNIRHLLQVDNFLNDNM